jgi:hypothetical protein
MLKSSEIDIVSPGKIVGHKKNIARKYRLPLGINCPGASPKKDNISLIIGEKGKQIPTQNMRS